MKGNVGGFTLDHTLNQSIVLKYGLLCALDCGKYKPIAKH